jgi:hypothetical protein
MSVAIDLFADPRAEPILRDCVATLRQVASYRLPAAIDRRLLWLSENKENLADTERDELLALVDFAEDRTLEKVKANATLKRLGELFPQLVSSHP